MKSLMPPTFWYWLFCGSGGKPGFSRIINGWMLVHCGVAFWLALYVPIELREATNSILAPLAGLLIGLAFAWAANAQALLQCEEVEEIVKNTKGGFPDYVYTYQLSVFIVLLTMILWGLASLGVFDKIWPKIDSHYYIGCKYVLYLMTSLTIRTCWHVVMGAQLMLIVRWTIRQNGSAEK